MTLDENYTIEKDHYNVILHYEETTDRVGKNGDFIVSREKWYYKNIYDALMSYMFKSINPNDSAEEIIRRIDEAEVNISNALNQEA